MSSAAGTDVWDRTWIGWDVAFGTALLVALAVALSDDDASDGGRRVAVAALVALGGWYAALGARALRLDATRLATGYLVGMIPLFLVAYSQVGAVGLLLFVLYPQSWALSESIRLALVANVVLTVGVGLVTFAAFDDPPAAALAQVGVSLGFSVAMGLWVTGIVRQSAGRKQVIAELEATRAELAVANREAGMHAERERLAREIHDTLAQGFTSVVVLLELAESEMDTDPAAARRRLVTARDTARQNLAEARSLVATLTPVDLQAAPLPEAVGRLVDRFAAETGLPARFAVDGVPRPLSAARDVVLLRAAQESLANVRKHAGTCRVTVGLRYRDEEVELTVTDDGAGFDPDAATGGYGLAGMRRRVEETGGRLAVHGGPGGTRVEVRC